MNMNALHPPQALAFDLDGTLVDSVADLAASANAARARFGLPPLEEAAVRVAIGDGARMLVLRCLEGREERLEEGLAVFRAHYTEHLLDHTRPYPGVTTTLALLARRPLAVVTNKPQAMAEAIVEGLRLRAFFTSVVGARPGVPVKPAPDALLRALEALGVAPPAAWMVGDSPNDLRAGRAAGTAVLAVTYGLTPPEDLRALEPDACLESFGDLLELVGEASGGPGCP